MSIHNPLYVWVYPSIYWQSLRARRARAQYRGGSHYVCIYCIAHMPRPVSQSNKLSYAIVPLIVCASTQPFSMRAVRSGHVDRHICSDCAHPMPYRAVAAGFACTLSGKRRMAPSTHWRTHCAPHRSVCVHLLDRNTGPNLSASAPKRARSTARGRLRMSDIAFREHSMPGGVVSCARGNSALPNPKKI